MSTTGVDPVPTWSVVELHEALNGLLVHVFGDEIWIEGELRNFKRSANQHVYFDLVDPSTDGDPYRPMLAVTLFSKERQAVNRHLTEQGGAVRMGDGVRVRIRGRLNIYGPRSTLQLRMSWIDPGYTLGVLGQERDRVLALVAADGLLERNAARALPPVALRVALVTSIGSAAHADALDELRRSGIGFRVSVLDARTQGVDAERSIVAALRTAAGLPVDVVLLVRGGGARTDLAAFDTESVARAIAASPLPVLTGIGHEIDRTVADEMAHTAHKTPTAAAAAVVAMARTAATSLHDVAGQVVSASRGRLTRSGNTLDQVARRAGRAATHHLERDRQSVDHLTHRLALCAPRATVAAGAGLDLLAARVGPAVVRSMAGAAGAVDTLELRARVHDPAVAMRRGFTVTRDEHGVAVRSAADLSAGETIRTSFADGTVTATVQASTPTTTPNEEQQ